MYYYSIVSFIHGFGELYGLFREYFLTAIQINENIYVILATHLQTKLDKYDNFQFLLVVVVLVNKCRTYCSFSKSRILNQRVYWQWNHMITRNLKLHNTLAHIRQHSSTTFDEFILTFIVQNDKQYRVNDYNWKWWISQKLHSNVL